MKKRNKYIIVDVIAGCVEVHGIPVGVKVKVRDYDVPDDANGIEYTETIYG